MSFLLLQKTYNQRNTRLRNLVQQDNVVNLVEQIPEVPILQQPEPLFEEKPKILKDTVWPVKRPGGKKGMKRKKAKLLQRRRHLEKVLRVEQSIGYRRKDGRLRWNRGKTSAEKMEEETFDAPSIEVVIDPGMCTEFDAVSGSEFIAVPVKMEEEEEEGGQEVNNGATIADIDKQVMKIRKLQADVDIIADGHKDVLKPGSKVRRKRKEKPFIAVPAGPSFGKGVKRQMLPSKEDLDKIEKTKEVKSKLKLKLSASKKVVLSDNALQSKKKGQSTVVLTLAPPNQKVIKNVVSVTVNESNDYVIQTEPEEGPSEESLIDNTYSSPGLSENNGKKFKFPAPSPVQHAPKDKPSSTAIKFLKKQANPKAPEPNVSMSADLLSDISGNVVSATSSTPTKASNSLSPPSSTELSPQSLTELFSAATVTSSAITSSAMTSSQVTSSAITSATVKQGMLCVSKSSLASKSTVTSSTVETQEGSPTVTVGDVISPRPNKSVSDSINISSTKSVPVSIQSPVSKTAASKTELSTPHGNHGRILSRSPRSKTPGSESVVNPKPVLSLATLQTKISVSITSESTKMTQPITSISRNTSTPKSPSKKQVWETFEPTPKTSLSSAPLSPTPAVTLSVSMATSESTPTTTAMSSATPTIPSVSGMAFSVLASGVSASGMASPVLASGVSASGMASPVLASGVSSSGMASPVLASGVSASGMASPVLASGVSVSGMASPVLASGVSVSGMASPVLASGVSSSGMASPVLASGVSSSGMASPVLAPGGADVMGNMLGSVMSLMTGMQVGGSIIRHNQTFCSSIRTSI